jgi:hypothetical protein
VDFSPVSSAAPPKFTNHDIQLVTQTLWKKEAAHKISRYSLGNNFDESAPASKRKIFFLSPFELLPNLILNVVEHLSF